MIVYVRYPDKKVDYVNSLTLGRLIREKAITAFFRPSEHQWIDAEDGRVRQETQTRYRGVERRAVNLMERLRRS
jgi:hypothetical protein